MHHLIILEDQQHMHLEEQNGQYSFQSDTEYKIYNIYNIWSYNILIIKENETKMLMLEFMLEYVGRIKKKMINYII